MKDEVINNKYENIDQYTKEALKECKEILRPVIQTYKTRTQYLNKTQKALVTLEYIQELQAGMHISDMQNDIDGRNTANK